MPQLRSIAVAVFLTYSMALAACESPSPPTAPAESRTARTAGAAAGPSSDVVVHEVGSDPGAVVDYWTPERMKSALPIESAFGLVLPLTQTPLGFSFDDEPAHVTDFLPFRERDVHPHTSIGKVYFVLNGFNFVCSASAVSTRGRWGRGSRNLIVTAGHCLNNGSGGFATLFIFVPGYNRGGTPFGVWAAERLYTTRQWNRGLGHAFGRDVGFARMHDAGGGLELHDVVDPLGIAFTEEFPEDGLSDRVRIKVGTLFALFGYPVPLWGGEDPVRTRSRVVTHDPNYSPRTAGVPSTFTGGSSGGPWIYRYARGFRNEHLNLVGSVNSYKHAGIDVMYGPDFDNAIHSLWMTAASE